jgi:hypothetical protein
MSSRLSSWPPIARDIVLDAARYYYQQLTEPFPVPDVAMDHAVAWANSEIEDRQDLIYEEASPRWIDRWGRGQLDAVMRAAIAETYAQLRRAERSRPRTKKSSAVLDAEIAQAIAARRR